MRERGIDTEDVVEDMEEDKPEMDAPQEVEPVIQKRKHDMTEARRAALVFARQKAAEIRNERTKDAEPKKSKKKKYFLDPVSNTHTLISNTDTVVQDKPVDTEEPVTPVVETKPEPTAQQIKSSFIKKRKHCYFTDSNI